MTSRRLLTPTAKALLDAADYMEQHGHYKGAFKSWRTGSVCAVGAITSATENSLTQCRAITALGFHITQGRADASPYIPAWNDHPERTADEVLAGLRGAAINPKAIAWAEEIDAPPAEGF